MMGNTVLWKPASSAVYTAYHIMRILEEAGLPPGVINFLPGDGAAVGEPVLSHPDLAGVHFTGSTTVFQDIWRAVGTNIARYRSYPRIVCETGEKDFVFAHASADVPADDTRAAAELLQRWNSFVVLRLHTATKLSHVHAKLCAACPRQNASIRR